ncbi:hypothetical protein KL86CLO1_11185 [uncultured Eubacteriales bacterium]|uniref:Uncharacterized protein n=1 Tax=uncultured Eubacteriales bacterium TaxID=172733 RepID=A0A212JIW6_9FIRM|nr:hypothetical protein KL86CLO1_11185 [uncultured Eubacteriales bacterium]
MDTGMRSGRYGLIAGLSEYGGAYFEQHPEAFNALVNGKTSWNGNMQGLRSGDDGLLGLPQGFNSGSNTSGMPILPGPVEVKDDWETAIEEAVAEQAVMDPENVDISGENGIVIGRGIGGTNGWFARPGLDTIKDRWVVDGDIGIEESWAILNPNEIRFSQGSVSGADAITANMGAIGWQGEPIDVVKMPDGKLTSVDNTRVASAKQAGIDVHANIHGYNDLLTPEQMSRFATKKGIPTTWGEAIRLRIGKQNSAFRNNFPSGSFDLPRFK